MGTEMSCVPGHRNVTTVKLLLKGLHGPAEGQLCDHPLQAGKDLCGVSVFLSRLEGFSSLLHLLPCSPPDLHVDFLVL